MPRSAIGYSFFARFGYYEDMPEQWIIRVEGKEYGPADLATLCEWKGEGRVIAANEARRVEVDPAAAAASAEEALWSTAANIPGLFESEAPPVQTEDRGQRTEDRGQRPENRDQAEEPVRSLREILGRTFWIYGQGFLRFLFLTLLIIGPSICAQLTAALVEATPNIDAELRTLVAGSFAFCMLLLTLAMWPVYIAGIQILSAESAADRRISFLRVLNEAIKFWPRVAFLCVFVYGSYLFWSVLLLGIVSMLLLGSVSLASIFLALTLLAFWVWIIGRLWVNFLFWQQFAVLEGCDVAESLRRSKELARSGKALPWFRRPLWRGVFIASLWFAVVMAINWPLVWPLTDSYFRTVTSTSDPQAVMEAMRAAAKASPSDLSLGLSFLQSILKPLLGIAFVLLYLDRKGTGES